MNISSSAGFGLERKQFIVLMSMIARVWDRQRQNSRSIFFVIASLKVQDGK